ncbi:MAG TPA: DNA primase [Chloroflexota bacterium]|nr:DNA primase [Chloroflexota bacterium]
MADPVIDDVKSRVDITELVGQRVQLKRAGKYFKGLCPFHQEKTPSFYVYPDQGTYHCYGCGKGGDVFTWLQETEHLEFGEALRRLADRAGVALPERAARKPDPEQTAAADALTEAAAWYHEQLLASPDAQRARAYLERRGLQSETVRRFQLGWAPDRRDQVVICLRGKGFSDKQLVDAGIVRETERGLADYMGGRVVFPIRDAEGRTRGFGGRTLGDNQPKYLNSPQTAFFDKSATLYGLDLARPSIRRDGVAVIVEGYMDVVVPHQEGFTNVVASLGTALTERQLELIKRSAPTIVLALDSDAAGQAATLRGLEVARLALSEARRPVPGRASRTGFLQGQSAQLKIAVITGGKDPDEIVREDPEAWRTIVASAVPMVDHKIEVTLSGVDLRDPAAKSAAVQELSRFLVQVSDPIEWAHYVDVVAHRLRTDVRAVRAEIDRAARAIRGEERRRAAQARDRSDSSPPAEGERPAPRLTGDAARGSSEGATPGEDLTEEQLVALLALEPQLMRRLPARLTPEDFRRPECRELYRAVLSQDEGRMPMDGWLQDYHDGLLRRARRQPPQSDSQMEAAVADMVRRIRERNLRQRVIETEYLLREAGTSDEVEALKQQVGQLTSQLLRVQLERSRASLYTSQPAS